MQETDTAGQRRNQTKQPHPKYRSAIVLRALSTVLRRTPGSKDGATRAHVLDVKTWASKRTVSLCHRVSAGGVHIEAGTKENRCGTDRNIDEDGHCRIDRQEIIESSYHSREDSILPPILYGRHMSVSSPKGNGSNLYGDAAFRRSSKQSVYASPVLLHVVHIESLPEPITSNIPRVLQPIALANSRPNSTVLLRR
eukprot:1184479-Prorocentrum_minimum.AAC.1